MRNIISLALLIIFPSLIQIAHAGSCIPSTGGAENGSLDVTRYISNPDYNYAGYSITVEVESTVPPVPVTCSCSGYDTSTSLWDWSSFNTPTEEADGKTYGIIGDYLSFAVSPRSGFWTPYENKEHKAKQNMCTSKTLTGGGANTLTIKIRRPFVGIVNIPRTLLYTKGTNTGSGEVMRDPEIQYYISGSVTVPQTCEFSPDKIVAIDFGNIGANLFSQAGAGNKPAGVNPQTKVIGIKCQNIEAKALLSLRLEANDVSGNAMVSDNPDLGFVIADGDNKPLTPNDINSKIPFQLDDNASASIPVTAWPVSVTGKKPVEGKFTAEGYLRVDFD